jgi:FkbM family methyltransferase
MIEATFEFRGKELHLVSPDTQMLNAGIQRFVTEGLFHRLQRGIPAPRRILDVGAAIGYYTMMFHEVWPEAEIWAIEPSSRNFRYLMANTGHIPNVRHIPFAAGEGTYTHTIAMPTVEQKTWQNNPGGNCGIMTLFGDSQLFREEVPVVKIDTEGYETKVIEGAARLLSKSRPSLHVEFIKSNQKLAGEGDHELQDLIQSFGYVHTEKMNQDVIFLPKERIDAVRS